MEHTINHQAVIDLFNHLLNPDTSPRLLRLIGEAKLGKSHFMTKVFPWIIEQHGVQCALLDLRNQSSIPEILHQLRGQLGGTSNFSAFNQAYQAWLDRSAANMQVSGLTAILSQITMRSEKESDTRQKVIPQLTTEFVADLRAIHGQTIVFLFDSVEQSEPSIHTWLMDSLLGQLAPLEHLRVVVAGRTLPEPTGNVNRYCSSYQLPPVKDKAAYLAYCQAIVPDKLEQIEESIQLIMEGNQYKPGLMVDFIKNLRGWANV